MGAGSDGVSEALLVLAALAVRRAGRELSLTAASPLATLKRTGPRRVTGLAAAESLTQPSMTAVATLQHPGLAERRRDPAAGRVVLLTLTTPGRRHLAASRRQAPVFTALIEKLPEQDTAALSAAVPAPRRLLQLADASRQPR